MVETRHMEEANTVMEKATQCMALNVWCQLH